MLTDDERDNLTYEQDRKRTDDVWEVARQIKAADLRGEGFTLSHYQAELLTELIEGEWGNIDPPQASADR